MLVALEAKMYDQPSGPKLTEQMRAQRVQLDYLREHLALDAIHHAALLPEGLAGKIAGELLTTGPDAFPIVRWEDLRNAYRTVRGDDDYFMAMLDLALSLWPTLAAKPSQFGANVEQYLSGQEILEKRGDAQVRMVGRRGGGCGELFAKDVATGTWKKRRYEVSSAETELAGNPNWFTVEEFAGRVTGA